MEDSERYYGYLRVFETEILIPGYEKELLVSNIKPVPVKEGKLSKTPFGLFLEGILDYEEVLVVDYYGYVKKSKGFLKKIKSLGEGVKVKTLECPVIHFASVKMETISQLNENLMISFPPFKEFIIKLRDFKTV